ncbi:pistil-specific extensin-like protein [Salvia splendens]|uniref:pistil-specific extensin-like protein n=1 Tax=Salvia splendens TaxID=180675 RepID=UPI001C27740B|nr:pistil-specific extensin-like protein [Salvia splendens]
MVKKKMASKQAAEKPPSILRDETPELQPPTEERPPSPQPQPQPPELIPQAPVMVPLNVLAEFLRQQDPNKDWAAALAGFSQIGGGSSMTGGTPVVPNPETNVQPTVHPPTSIPTSPTTPPEKKSPSMTAPSESSKPSPTYQQIEPMDVVLLSAYYDSNLEERKGKKSREEGDDRREHR